MGIVLVTALLTWLFVRALSVDDAGAVVSSLHSTVSSLARRPLVSEPAPDVAPGLHCLFAELL